MNIPHPRDGVPDLPPPELFPTKSAWIAREVDGKRVLDVMSWGFPRLLTKSGEAVDKPITSVRKYSTPFWRSAMAKPERRCLVPVTAFSDWMPRRPSRRPLHWFSIPSRPVFALAGVWRPLGNSAVFAFLTCDANPLVGAVDSDTMPVILHEADHNRWLECDYEAAIELAVPYPSELMTNGLAS